MAIRIHKVYSRSTHSSVSFHSSELHCQIPYNPANVDVTILIWKIVLIIRLEIKTKFLAFQVIAFPLNYQGPKF